MQFSLHEVKSLKKSWLWRFSWDLHKNMMMWLALSTTRSRIPRFLMKTSQIWVFKTFSLWRYLKKLGLSNKTHQQQLRSMEQWPVMRVRGWTTQIQELEEETRHQVVDVATTLVDEEVDLQTLDLHARFVANKGTLLLFAVIDWTRHIKELHHLHVESATSQISSSHLLRWTRNCHSSGVVCKLVIIAPW